MIKISLPTIMSKLLNISEKSYYRWKKKDHSKLIDLIETHFTKEELQEFLETGKIEKQEIIKKLSFDELKNIKEFKRQLISDEIKRMQEKIEELKTLENIQ